MANANGECYTHVMHRCPWCGSDPLYVAYHDDEWGVPLHDERRHFEFLLLETQQAGLSWRTILGKREAYRHAFAGFDPEKVARFGESDLLMLLQNPGIVRNRRKLEAAVINARRFLEIEEHHGSFDAWIWGFVDGIPIDGRRSTLKDLPVTTPLSERVAAEMRKLGFAFTGPVTIQAHLQAIGIFNDHLLDCFRHDEIQAMTS